MLKSYLIRAGFTFLMPDGTVKVGGDKVELPPDVAAQHLHKLEADPDAKVKPPKKAKEADAGTPAPEVNGAAGDGTAEDPDGAAAAVLGGEADPA